MTGRQSLGSDPYDAHVLDRLGGRERVIRFLTATVVIGIIVWIVTETAFYIFILGPANTAPNITNMFRWAQILSRIAFDLWLGALALLLLLWLLEGLLGSAPSPQERDPGQGTDPTPD